MRIIHCTQKLLKELGTPPIENVDSTSSSEGLGNWYANLIRIERRKCLLFTSEKTLYTFLIPSVLKANIKNLQSEFLNHLILNLKYEEFGLDIINHVREEYQEIGFAKTASKTVLGFMNEFAFIYEVEIQGVEGIRNLNLMEVNARINRMPLHASKRESFHPIDVMRKTAVQV